MEYLFGGLEGAVAEVTGKFAFSPSFFDDALVALDMVLTLAWVRSNRASKTSLVALRKFKFKFSYSSVICETVVMLTSLYCFRAPRYRYLGEPHSRVLNFIISSRITRRRILAHFYNGKPGN